MAETDVQYSEVGTQTHAPALDRHNKFKQFFLACTMYMYDVHRQVPSKLFALETSWRAKKHKGIPGKKKQNSIFKPFCILYVYRYSISADQQTAHIQIPEYL